MRRSGNSHHHAYCIIYTDLEFILLICLLLSQNNANKSFPVQYKPWNTSTTVPHILCDSSSIQCVTYSLQFSLHSLPPAQYELWNSQVQLLIYVLCFQLNTRFGILNHSSPHTLCFNLSLHHTTNFCSSHTSASFMYIKGKFFRKFCNAHSKN